MNWTTICCSLWLVVGALDICVAQSTDRNPVEAFIPDPGDFLPPVFRETEQDRQRLNRVAVTSSEERRLGERFFSSFVNLLEKQGTEIERRGPDVRYLQTLVGELRPRMKNARRYRRINLVVADTDAPDARAFPGGAIIFSRGMLELAESEAAIVGVLAHELSHIDRGHQLDGLRRQKLAQKTISSGRVTPQEFFSAGKLFTSQFLQPFHPEQETEADSDATGWLIQAGYDPMEMARLFLRMHERTGGAGRFVPRFLQTHPYFTDRFAAVQAAAETSRKNGVLYVGKENLKQRIPRSQQIFPE